MEDSLKVLAEWLKGSGMKINEAKTELCLFYKKDQLPVEITLSGVSIRSTDSINIAPHAHTHTALPAQHTNYQCPHPNASRFLSIRNAFLCPLTVLFLVAYSCYYENEGTKFTSII